MTFLSFRLLYSVGEWWPCDKSVFLRCCVSLWSSSMEASPAPERGWSETSSGLPPPPPPPWSLRTRLYQTGSGLWRSTHCCPPSSRSSRLPAPGCRSRSGTSAGVERDSQSHLRVFLHLYSHTFIHNTFDYLVLQVLRPEAMLLQPLGFGFFALW